MRLSNEELARLELMFASGQVHSDPATLSDTDRMMDALMHAAKMRNKARIDKHDLTHDSRANQHIPREIPRAQAANPEVADREGGKILPDSTAAGELHVDWAFPRTLAELIQIRRALMHNKEPRL